MFCDGKCEHKGRRCGLYASMTLKNDLTGDVKQIDRCVLWGIMESLHRQEQGQIRIQAAVESGRNETVKIATEISDTITKGAIGMLKAAQYKMIQEEKGHRGIAS